MKFTLIVCTYNRPGALKQLLDSVEGQKQYPNQILIIDGSADERTRETLQAQSYKNLEYYNVNEKDRGLTKQRNFGVNKVSPFSEIICFLDDDIVLTPEYFETLLYTYKKFPDALGVGGYIVNEVKWEKASNNNYKYSNFIMDGWVRKLGSRNVFRKKLGLLSDAPPGYMPAEGNGFSTGFLPPSREIYTVEFFMGGVSSYRSKLFNEISFSPYFEGYGLYEDMDFCLRAFKLGSLYVNTRAQLYHYHESEGRPNKYKYGKMVIRNGWYVWRVKYENPPFVARLKWHSIAFVLTSVRLLNTFTTKERKESFIESLGRVVGWWSLIWNPPNIER